MIGPIRTYVVNMFAPSALLSDVDHFIRADSSILAFWNHIPLVYCIKSRESATSLAQRMRWMFPQGNFFVAEIDPLNMDGSLSQQAWDWFYEDEHPPMNALMRGKYRGPYDKY